MAFVSKNADHISAETGIGIVHWLYLVVIHSIIFDLQPVTYVKDFILKCKTLSKRSDKNLLINAIYRPHKDLINFNEFHTLWKHKVYCHIYDSCSELIYTSPHSWYFDAKLILLKSTFNMQLQNTSDLRDQFKRRLVKVLSPNDNATCGSNNVKPILEFL